MKTHQKDAKGPCLYENRQGPFTYLRTLFDEFRLGIA